MATYRGQPTSWGAENVLNYIRGFLALEDDEEEEYTAKENAFAAAYGYLTGRITWSVDSEKIAYLFINLAFELEKQFSIKEVLKSYRNHTQGQYSDSLRVVLEYYRDEKLETILREEIKEKDLAIIHQLPSIETDEASTQVIISSFKPELKRRSEELKHKLKIVWEGYKTIVETVRINQKLEEVYMTTLRKIFTFVSKYNRIHEFKQFCKTMRSALQNALGKRDKSEQLKGIYIDIGQTEVNNRNIEIRLEQFEVTTKLGLWEEAFQVLEYINNLIKVRKSKLKNSLKCSYFFNLALLFRKSNYWHYHAYAFYNYYITFLTNPKITQTEKQKMTDKLLLSVMCIPSVPAESFQGKESQEKICLMIMSNAKIPNKKELYELIISSGAVQGSSGAIKQLWDFMFVEFDLTSLSKGVKLLRQISDDYSDFKTLLQDILISKQLLSIAEVYKKIKTKSLLAFFPTVKEEKVYQILFESQQEILNFSLDEDKGIVIFESRHVMANPYDQFQDIFLEVALLKEQHSKKDSKFIISKAEHLLAHPEQDYMNYRNVKIYDYKRKLKEEINIQGEKQRLREVNRKLEKDFEESERKRNLEEARKLSEKKEKELIMKTVIQQDIIKFKEHRVVRMLGVKVEDLTNKELENIPLEAIEKERDLQEKKMNEIKEAKFKKLFNTTDYYERETKDLINKQITKNMISEEEEEKRVQEIITVAEANFKDRKAQKEKFENSVELLKKIKDEQQKENTKYKSDLVLYKDKLENKLYKIAVEKAVELLRDQEKKREDAERRRQEELDRQVKFSPWLRMMNTGPSDRDAEVDDKPWKIGNKLGDNKDQAPETQFRLGKKFQQNKAEDTAEKGWNLGGKSKKTVESSQPSKEWNMGAKVKKTTEPTESSKDWALGSKVKKTTEPQSSKDWALGSKVKKEPTKPSQEWNMVKSKKTVESGEPTSGWNLGGKKDKKPKDQD